MAKHVVKSELLRCGSLLSFVALHGHALTGVDGSILPVKFLKTEFCIPGFWREACQRGPGGGVESLVPCKL